MSTSPSLISVRATETLVDALNSAVEFDGGTSAQIEFLLQRLQALLNRRTRCVLWLIADLQRDPAPVITSRTVVQGDDETRPPEDLAQAQSALDASAPLSDAMVRSVLASIRTPVTKIVSEAGETAWFENVLRPKYLQPNGFIDCIASMWATASDRAIFLLVHRRGIDAAFSAGDVTLVSLMLRAVAPFLDREIFQRQASDVGEQLSRREREILLLLLAGESEKQIAAALSRSINTVHTFVRQIYRRLNVASRGELMALFVDKAVLASLKHTTPA